MFVVNGAHLQMGPDMSHLVAMMIAFSSGAAETSSVVDDSKSETRKIEALIKRVEQLKDAVFVRNGTEYDAKTAATFLRRKWGSNKSEIKTAKDFIEKAASVSSTSGKPYLIRKKDGTETKSGDFLRAELKQLEKPPEKKDDKK